MKTKYALIMGASGDIGCACARKLAAAGWSLYCHYYQNQVKNKQLVTELSQKYPQQDFFSVSLDMSQSEDIDHFLCQLYDVSAVVFASGTTVYKLLTETSSEEIELLWHTHVKVPILLCQKLQNKLSASQNGRIVFIGSVYGISGSALEVVYSAMKGAQQSFAKAYAQEVASLGMTVNVVAPGAVNTRMNQDWTNEERAMLMDEIPAHRMAEPIEIASVVEFLLQEDAKYLTGVTIPVTGGWKI